MEKIYIITAYRYGNREAHSYVIGAFEKKAQAIKAAEKHTDFRRGKYSCHAEEVTLNHYNDQDDDHSKTIHITKIPYELRN